MTSTPADGGGCYISAFQAERTRCQARWRYDSFNSCAEGGRDPGDATVAHLAGGLVRRALLERPRPGIGIREWLTAGKQAPRTAGG